MHVLRTHIHMQQQWRAFFLGSFTGAPLLGIDRKMNRMRLHVSVHISSVPHIYPCKTAVSESASERRLLQQQKRGIEPTTQSSAAVNLSSQLYLQRAEAVPVEPRHLCLLSAALRRLPVGKVVVRQQYLLRQEEQ